VVYKGGSPERSSPVRSSVLHMEWGGAVVIRISEEDEALRYALSYSHLHQADAGLGDVPPGLSALLPSFVVALVVSA